MANRLSAAQPTHGTKAYPAATTLALVARVSSRLLLKTTLPRPAEIEAPTGRIFTSIAGYPASRNAIAGLGGWPHLYFRCLAGGLTTVAHLHGQRQVKAAKTIATPHGLERQYGEEVSFKEGPATRSDTVRAATIGASEVPEILSPMLSLGELLHVCTSRRLVSWALTHILTRMLEDGSYISAKGCVLARENLLASVKFASYL